MEPLKGLDKALLLKISGIGRDRIGITEKITKVIKDNGGNIIINQAMLVAGDFAIILLAAFDETNVTGVEAVQAKMLPNFIGNEFLILCRHAELSDIAPIEQEGTRYDIEVWGLDRPGIVNSICLLLLRHNLNLILMKSDVRNDAFSGTERFYGLFQTVIPIGFDMPAFLAEIEEFDQLHYCETTVRPTGN